MSTISLLDLILLVDRIAKDAFYTSEKRYSVVFPTDYDKVKATNFGGACATLSGIIQRVLQKCGVETKLFQTQSLVIGHVWLETIEGIVIDPTINQFAGNRKTYIHIGERRKGIHPFPKPRVYIADSLPQFSQESYEAVFNNLGSNFTLSPQDVEELAEEVLSKVKPAA